MLPAEWGARAGAVAAYLSGAMSEDAGQGGFNCQFGKEIWNNSEPDAAVLINPEGAEVARR